MFFFNFFPFGIHPKKLKNKVDTTNRCEETINNPPSILAMRRCKYSGTPGCWAACIWDTLPPETGRRGAEEEREIMTWFVHSCQYLCQHTGITVHYTLIYCVMYVLPLLYFGIKWSCYCCSLILIFESKQKCTWFVKTWKTKEVLCTTSHESQAIKLCKRY